MRLHFVSAPGGSAFMHELLGVVAHEVSALGPASPVDEVTVSEGPLPAGDADDVYVVVPHEYFVVLPARSAPGAEQLARTIGFCVEHTGTATFETTVRKARPLAACVDINDDSTMALNRLGIPTERFVLGYSERWDLWGGRDSVRPYDVVYLGTSDDRRSRLLALDSDVLDEMNVLLAMPPHEPMTRPRPDFYMGEDKLRLLAASKVLLNLHRGDSRSLEWVRVLEAMCNGCVVVSEHSPDIAPLCPGAHLLLGRPRTLAHLARSVLTDASRLENIRANSYEMLRTRLTMRPAALMLAQLATEVAAGYRHTGHRPVRPPRRAAWPRERAGELADEGCQAEAESDLAHAVPRPWAPTSPTGARGRRPDRDADSLDAVVVRSPGWPDVAATVASLLAQLDGPDVTVHVCYDGEDPSELADDRRLVVHGGPARTGPGAARNRALDESDAAEVLVLDSTDRLGRHALARLRQALRDQQSDAAYGMVVRPDGLLTSAMPFETDRLACHDYIATAALWRRATLVDLGGWSDDPDLDGAETWDLWRRLGASGGSAVLVPRPLVYQTFRQDPPIGEGTL
jgi:hypothetical protein